MNNDLKDPARVRFFPYVVTAYNIYVLIKGMASHWLSTKENMGQSRLEKGNNILPQIIEGTKAWWLNAHQVYTKSRLNITITTNSTKVFGTHNQMDRLSG